MALIVRTWFQTRFREPGRLRPFWTSPRRHKGSAVERHEGSLTLGPETRPQQALTRISFADVRRSTVHTRVYSGFILRIVREVGL
jgi:hypothetical protein